MIFLWYVIVIPAYIDPNTGGMLFQILAVLFGVISGALLLFSGKIKGVYYQLKRKVTNSSANIGDDPERNSPEEQS
jgi:hypothetical protein